MAKRTRGNPIPLIVENHPEEYDGYPFITLIQYRKDHFLTIIDNSTPKQIKSYVLDLCGPSRVNEELVIEIASDWWNKHREYYPLSFEFSKKGLTRQMSSIYRSFNIEYVTRIIGPLPKFEMQEVQSVKRRKRKGIPKGMKINNKVTSLL